MLLKQTLLVIFLLCCFELRAEELDVEAVEQKDEDLTNQLKQILQCLAEKLKDGVPSMGIPSLDPLQVSEVRLDDLDGGYIHLDNVTVQGILDLDVTSFDIGTCTSICLIGDFLLPSLSLTTAYDIDVTLFDTLRVYGQGDISLAISDIVPSLTVGISTAGIDQFNLDLSIGEVEFDATGLLNDDYMSKLISNMIKSIIKEHLNDIVQKVVATLLAQIENGEGSDIDLGNILELVLALVTDCLTSSSMQTFKMETLLRR